MTQPRVTVLIAVRNGEAHLQEAIDSILSQTFTDFELQIIDDGSTDGTAAILSQYRDPRIKLIRNESNLGLTRSLNIGLTNSRGEYIARMDADDISLPERLAKQVALMDANPDIGICGCWMEVMGDRQAMWHSPSDPDEMKVRLLFQNVLAHPTVMMRKSVLEEHLLRYDEAFTTAQDYELWSRMLKVTKATSLQEALLRYRMHGQSVSSGSGGAQALNSRKVRESLLRSLGLNFDGAEADLHESISLGQYPADMVFVGRLDKWFAKLSAQNKLSKVYAHPKLLQVLTEKFFSSLAVVPSGRIVKLRRVISSRWLPLGDKLRYLLRQG